MESRLKLRISNMFQSSFNSCRSKNISDVSDQPFFFPENHHHRRLIDLFSPKPQSFTSSSCKPKWHAQSDPKTHLSRQKISDKDTLFPAAADGRRPHSGYPVSPLFYEKASKKTKIKKARFRKNKKIQDFSSIADNYYYDWCTSDEEDESDNETTLFSSRSFSSDSSESFRKNRARRMTHKKSKKKGAGGGGGCKDRKATDVIEFEGIGKFVKDCFAVVKKSTDPHADFRESMVEMIVEEEIFGEEDLQNLLKCFLSLNSEEHHRVIIEVFTEIWETLFQTGFD